MSVKEIGPEKTMKKLLEPSVQDLDSQLEELRKEVNSLRISLLKLECERNALIQALRIYASEGKVDVVKPG